MKPLKRTLSVLLFFLITLPYGISAQSFVGLTTSANSITEIFNNPAFAVNDDKYEVNVVGFSILAGNSGYSFNGNISDNSNFTKNAEKTAKSAWLNADILGPAATLKVKKRYSFGISTRTRFLLNADNISNDVFKLINAKADSAHQYTLNNFSMSTQVFSELNLVYSGYFYNSEDYNLMGGIDVKLLMGYGAMAVGVPHAVFNVYTDNTLNSLNATGKIAFTPYANKWLSAGTPSDALMNGTNNLGLGLDMGMVYIYTPINEFTGKRDGYDFRAAISITDIGSINYTASSTTGTYTAKADTFEINKLDKSASTTYGQNLEKYINDSILHQTASKTKFRVGLPTALHINADLRAYSSVNANIWINTNILINLRSPSADKYASHYITTFTVTPRALFHQLGFGIPFSFNEYKQGTLGLVLYAGPFYLGSSTAGNLLFNKFTGADVFMGLAFRIKPKESDGLRGD